MIAKNKVINNRYTRPVYAWVAARAVSRRWSRNLINSWYNTLGYPEKLKVYDSSSKLFRSRKAAVESGLWVVSLSEGMLSLPMDSASMSLDWDHAVSILGHDQEIKSTYAGILASAERPDVFMDVGANFGMHSALMATAGIKTISFEPNPKCGEYFRRLAAANTFQVQWEAVALGDHEGEIELSFPENETWLGSVMPEVTARLAALGKLTSCKARLTTLDSYLGNIPPGKILMKMDVEGAELPVLNGGSEFLRQRQPYLIFESNEMEQRPAIAEKLASLGYSIRSLPWLPPAPAQRLTRDAFIADVATNFIALPEECL